MIGQKNTKAASKPCKRANEKDSNKRKTGGCGGKKTDSPLHLRLPENLYASLKIDGDLVAGEGLTLFLRETYGFFSRTAS